MFLSELFEAPKKRKRRRPKIRSGYYGYYYGLGSSETSGGDAGGGEAEAKVRENSDDTNLPSVVKAKQLIPLILKKAQQDYDDWDESLLDTYAGGGICHIIADSICNVLFEAGIECTPVSCDYEQHVYVAAKFAEGVYTIDIPYHIYETGGGFSWKKIPDVQFDSRDVVFYKTSSDPGEFENYSITESLISKQGVAEAQGQIQLGPQLFVSRQTTMEGIKPRAVAWTSTAQKTNQGFTSDWVEWCKDNMAQWVTDTGILYEVAPGARILLLHTDRDAIRVARRYGLEIKNSFDLFEKMDWDILRKDYDAIHHIPQGRNVFMSTWDVESTAWFDKKFLTNPRKVKIDTGKTQNIEAIVKQGVAEGKMAELDMDLEDPEITDSQFEKMYGMTRKEARELFSRTNMWDFPDFRDPNRPLHEQGVAEGATQKQGQVRQTLNAWMNKDQQYKDPTQREGFQAKVWPYIQKNIKTILADKGEKGNGDYPAAPYAAWLLVQHMDAYPQNQIEFYNALKQAIPDHPKIQFLRDRAAVNQWIMKNANNPKYFINGKALPNPTVNVRNPAIFKDAGIVATSREEALSNAEQAGNKLLVAAVTATNAQTQPSYEQSANQDQQGVAEGKVIHTYLWHGSRQKIPMLEPRQAVDTGGAAGSNQNAIYATSDPIFATQMGMPAAGSDYGSFPNDPQMVLFSGKIRKGEYVYLHKLPFNGPDGKPQFVRGGNNREFHSIPGVEGIKPIEIKKIPVNKYLNLIRKATPADWKLRKKYMKQGVAEDTANLPSVLYHATYKPRLKSIKLKGLGAGGKRNWEDSKRGIVYLSLDPNVAESYAETSDMVPEEWLDEIVILKISTAGLDPNKFHIDSNVQDNAGDTVEYHGVIPVSNISMYKQGVAEDQLDENVAELYHGTLATNVDSILANGLNPTVGEFTRSIYANKAKPLVFAADINGSRAVYCSLVGQMNAKLGITAYPPSAEDVAKHCAILVISKDVGKFRQYNSKRRQGSKEPTDYTAEQTIHIDKVLRGKELLAWIKTHNADRGEMCPIDNQQGVAENFADGKNPGRKGLAKRMGVPTKASVTRLRQIAKKSTGEKQRMAHWMANMKAGKRK